MRSHKPNAKGRQADLSGRGDFDSVRFAILGHTADALSSVVFLKGHGPGAARLLLLKQP